MSELIPPKAFVPRDVDLNGFGPLVPGSFSGFLRRWPARLRDEEGRGIRTVNVRTRSAQLEKRKWCGFEVTGLKLDHKILSY